MINLSNLAKVLGVDRLSMRRYIERNGTGIDENGDITIEDAKKVLQHVAASNTGGDQREKAKQILTRLSSQDSQDWIKAMGLTSEKFISDVEPESEPEQSQPIYSQPKKQPTMNEHIGLRILKDPWTAMFFTLFALLGQAYLFAHLAHRVFEGINIPAPYWFHYTIAVIFESTGILIASSFNDRKIGDDFSARGLWLATFFVVQVVADLCLFNIIQNPAVGTILVAIAMPIALLGYANLYMEENRK